MKHTLTKQAADTAEMAMALVMDALSDPVSPGVIDATELPTVMPALLDWRGMTHRAHGAASLARAIECGVGDTDPRYLFRLVDGYLVKIDGEAA